ncbi:ribonuclease H-like domain-containing protein [Pseudomonas sp. CGJS7]|uniref:ribonuclease H-like domain-containing protein n=1 Tax=Pseudomonas sp. CGJS7 TaxID=3109348 RepID=UPI003008F230
MSIDLAKLRALRRQAGSVEAVAEKANLPRPLFSKEGRQAVASRSAESFASPEAEPAPQAANASTPLFGKEGLGEIRSSRPDIDALRRLIALRERKPATPPDPAPTHASLTRTAAQRSSKPDRSLPGKEIAPGLHLIQAHLPLPATESALNLAFAKRPDDSLDPRRLLFFDTETTGLAGGTGTRAFMIGAADWHRDPLHGDGLRIRQLMISTLSAEPAMLRAFAQWIAPDTVLSSYNGRCYDAPLLNTRYRLARIANPLSGLDHVDLLFPTRRMYRGVWENCRLATIERELLRIVREDDLPGSQAPAAWLHYLRGGSSSLLRRVAAHNHQDVATLAQLLLRLIQSHRERADAEPVVAA